VLIANCPGQGAAGGGRGERRPAARGRPQQHALLVRAGPDRHPGGRPRELLLVDPVEGSDLLFELSARPPRHPRGHRLVSILRNISDLRRASEEIEENYRRLRIAEADVRAERDRLDLIIDSVADPIW
jgi:hypothetical protein